MMKMVSLPLQSRQGEGGGREGGISVMEKGNKGEGEKSLWSSVLPIFYLLRPKR